MAISTNRLSEKITTVLNNQITMEAKAAQIYLSYAIWASDLGYDGVANFLFRHSSEERNHMTKIVQYMLQRGAKPKVSAIDAPPADPSSLDECFHKVLEHEVNNTNTIYDCVNASFDEKDWATWNFMQWFVKEQIEEEALALDLIDKISVAGGTDAPKAAIYMLNKELEGTPDEMPSAESATAESPL